MKVKMNIRKMSVTLLVLMLTLVPVLCSKNDLKEDNKAQVSNEINNISDGIVKAYLLTKLEPFEGTFIPAIPTLKFNAEEYVNVALSLANVELNGLTDITVTDSELDSLTKPTHVKTKITFNKIMVDFGYYSSGGHILNLPFAGEGPLLIAVHKFSINLDMDLASMGKGKYCARSNSAAVDLDLRRLQVEFENMNPGTDQGQLINIVLSSFGPDIVDYLEMLINDQDTTFVQEVAVDIINSSLCPNWVSNSPLDDTDKLQEHFEEIVGLFKQGLRFPMRGS